MDDLWLTILVHSCYATCEPQEATQGLLQCKSWEPAQSAGMSLADNCTLSWPGKRSSSSAMQSSVLCGPCCRMTHECATQVHSRFHALTMASLLLLRSVESTISLLKTILLSGWTLDTLTVPAASTSTYATSPSANSPFRMASDRASSTIRVMARLRGRAPYSCTGGEFTSGYI